MSERSKPGSFVHVEFHSTDPQRTKDFYGKVFGWKFQDMPEMEYTTFEAPSGLGGGVMRPLENNPPGALNYILCPEIEETAKDIETAGGAILMPKTEIPGVGWWALFRDPTGITMALFQSKPEERSHPSRKRRAARPRKAAKRVRAARRRR